MRQNGLVSFVYIWRPTVYSVFTSILFDYFFHLAYRLILVRRRISEIDGSLYNSFTSSQSGYWLQTPSSTSFFGWTKTSNEGHEKKIIYSLRSPISKVGLYVRIIGIWPSGIQMRQFMVFMYKISCLWNHVSQSVFYFHHRYTLYRLSIHLRHDCHIALRFWSSNYYRSELKITYNCRSRIERES